MMELWSRWKGNRPHYLGQPSFQAKPCTSYLICFSVWPGKEFEHWILSGTLNCVHGANSFLCFQPWFHFKLWPVVDWWVFPALSLYVVTTSCYTYGVQVLNVGQIGSNNLFCSLSGIFSSCPVWWLIQTRQWWICREQTRCTCWVDPLLGFYDDCVEVELQVLGDCRCQKTEGFHSNSEGGKWWGLLLKSIIIFTVF